MSMTMRRDPFAREELRRDALGYRGGSCSWCGGKPRTLFTYKTVSDGGRVSLHRGAFCNVECRDAYHG